MCSAAHHPLGSQPSWGCQETTGPKLAPIALSQEEEVKQACMYGFVSHIHGDVPSELLQELKTWKNKHWAA